MASVLLAGLRKIYRNDCLARDSSCRGKAVDGHSVQNSVVLDALAENNHVSMVTLTGDSMRFELIGRNKATTFSGFCSNHDRELFKEVDYAQLRDIDLSSPRQAYQHLLRAAAMELWKKRKAVFISNAIASRNSDFVRACGIMGLNPAGIAFDQESLVPMGYGQRLGLKESWENYTELRRLTHRSTFSDEIVFVSRILRVPANFSVVSGVSPTQDLFGSPLYDVGRVIDRDYPMPHMGLAILPHGEGTAVLVAMPRKSRFRLQPILDQVAKLPDRELEIPLSKLVINNCENSVFKPSAVESMSADEKGKCLRDYLRSVDEELSVREIAPINLFRLGNLA
ncbi:MAG: hypothetical protein WCU88_03605 [Elusimicrobiota bacterium]|jgi:hypothetical protein